MVPILGAIAGGLGLVNGIKSLFGGGGGQGQDPLAALQATQEQALARSSQMNAMTAEFQSQQEALKAVSEALNASHDANMQALGKVGSAARG